jgi:hypothetical protein
VEESVRFEMLGEVAVYRASGRMRFQQAIVVGKTAIEAARRQGMRKLLLVTSALEGVEPPSVGDRAFMAREWAGAAGRAMHVAVVARAELIDPEKVAVMMVRNFGASMDVFVDEADALAWLEQFRD